MEVRDEQKRQHKRETDVLDVQRFETKSLLLRRIIYLYVLQAHLMHLPFLMKREDALSVKNCTVVLEYSKYSALQYA